MPKSIFVADDEQQGLSALATALAEAGYAPVVSPANNDAVAAFVEIKPELVFVSLRTADPAAVCEGIRSDPDGAIVPIVLVGDGSSDVRSPADALHQGADYYFGLPLDIAKVLAKVRTYIGSGEKTPHAVRRLSADPGAGAAQAAVAVEVPPEDPSSASAHSAASVPSLPPYSAGRLVEASVPSDIASAATPAALSAQPATTAADLATSAEALLTAIAAEQSRADAELRRRVEEETRLRVEEETRRRVEEETRVRVEEETRRRVEEETRRRLEEEARRRVEEETRRRVEEETRRRVEEEMRRRMDEEARRRADEAALRRIEEETRLRVEDETRRRLEEQARQKADEEERQKAERERRRAEVGGGERADPSRAAALGRRGEDGSGPVTTAASGAATGTTALSPVDGLLDEAHDVAWVFFEAYRQGITGRIDFTSETRQKSLFFEQGVPVDAYSSQVSDRIEEYLLREGRITRTQYREVRSQGLRGPRRVAAYLASAGFLKSEELLASVRGHLEEVVYSLFEWEDGAWRYTAERAAEMDRVTLAVDPRALVFEGIRRKYVLPRLVARVGGPSSVLAPAGTPAELEGLHLRPEERDVARWLDGKRSLQDIAAGSGLAPLRVYHVAAALVSVAWAQVTIRGLEGARHDAPAAPDVIDRERIADKLEQARNLDYFQVLGVARTATAFEIERAYEHNRQEFHPARFSPALQEQMREHLAEIEQVLDEAYSVLREERLREAYARHLPG